MEVGKFSRRSFFYFALFGAVILIVGLLMIYPNYRTLTALDRNIWQLKVNIENQKLLFPLFQRLLKEINLKLPEGVSEPKQEKLSPEKEQTIVSTFHGMADSVGLKVLEISPDVASTLDGSGYLLMNLAMEGDFHKIRELLLEVGKLPYLGKIERIKLQNTAKGGQKEVHLKIWLKRETKK